MKNNNQKTIVLVGGGTGGHAAPLLAVYEKLHELSPETKIVAIGVGTKEEKEFLKNIPEYKTIKAGKFNRFLTLRNLAEAVRFAIGFCQSLSFLRKFKPDVIFAKGGFVSLPVIYAARLFKIPYFIHESDIEMGSANKLLAKHAVKTFVTFPTECLKVPGCLVFSGPLLRKGFLENEKGKTFQFENSKPTILITGGSQGSLNLSKNFIGTGKELLEKYNVIHQAGRHSIEEAEKFKKTLSPELSRSYYLTPFLKVSKDKDEMREAINAADLVISRASSTISEVALLGKPMLLIPWRHAANDHQLKNAIFLSKKNAAEYISEENLTPELLKEKVDALLIDKEKLSLLVKNEKNIFPKNGTEIIAKELLNKENK